MEVTIRDRSAEPPQGSGPLRVAVRTAVIDDNCPQCGGPRGEPQGLNQHEDGIWYRVQIWDNPCGHVDSYRKVVQEAKAHGTLGPVRLY